MNGPTTFSRWTETGVRPMSDSEDLAVFPPTSNPPAVSELDTTPSRASTLFQQFLWVINATAFLGLVGYFSIKASTKRRQWSKGRADQLTEDRPCFYTEGWGGRENEPLVLD